MFSRYEARGAESAANAAIDGVVHDGGAVDFVAADRGRASRHTCAGRLTLDPYDPRGSPVILTAGARGESAGSSTAQPSRDGSRR